MWCGLVAGSSCEDGGAGGFDGLAVLAGGDRRGREHDHADHISVLEGDLAAPVDQDPSALDGTVVGYYQGSRLVGVVMLSPSPVTARKYREAVETSRTTVLTA